MREKSPERRTTAASGFVLKADDVRRFLEGVPLERFLSCLMDEIALTYCEADLVSEKRTGWTSPELDTQEIMGCHTPDEACRKDISSKPSSRRFRRVVEGELSYERLTGDQRSQLHCDATALTPIRTAASTAAVIRRLGRRVSSVGIVGAGLEGQSHALVLALMFPDVKCVNMIDLDVSRARRAVAGVEVLLRRTGALDARTIEIVPGGMDDLGVVTEADVVVTATYGVAAYGTSPVLRGLGDDFFARAPIIAAVGADLIGKRELDGCLYERAGFLADDLSQCLREGELQYAKRTLQISEEELAQIVDHRGTLAKGRVASCAEFFARRDGFADFANRLVVYDSTGFSGQDLAIARVVWAFLEEMGWRHDDWNPSGEGLLDLMTCSDPE